MKDKYIKHKKRIKSFLALGTTVSAIGLFAFITDLAISGLFAILFGLLVLFLANKSKGITVKIEKECLEKCIICNDPINKTIETRYYYSGNIINEEEFNKYSNNKIKRIIYYYKCEKCNLCMTVIKSYLYVNNKEKEMNEKIELDFNYEGDY